MLILFNFGNRANADKICGWVVGVAEALQQAHKSIYVKQEITQIERPHYQDLFFLNR